MKVQESSPGYDVLAQSDSSDEWTLIPLKELGTWSGGGTPSKSKLNYWEDGTIPWVSPKDMKTDHIVDSEDHITQAAVAGSAAKLISAGSVLIVTRSGILSHTLPVAVTTVPVTVNQDLKALTPREGVLPEYVAWALRCFAREILNTCSKQGTTVSSIETAALHRFEIPVAPLDQQKRIVAEIEKQFSRLDEAVANLKRVKASLKRYKAAVLKAAVEGRLVETEAELARREGRSYETGEQLLQRILETRRSQWQGKGKYKEPSAPVTTGLPELPEGWVWANFESAADRVTVGHVGSMIDEYVEEGVPFLRSQNVRANRYDPEGLKFVSEKFHRQLGKSSLKPGDIVVVRSGSVGVSCVIPDHLPEANCSDLVIIKTPRAVLPDFGAYYMNSVVETRVAAGKVGIALTHFNTQSVAELPLPVPPLAEQHRIVAEVDRRLSLIRKTEAQVDANLQRTDFFRRSMLAKAFSSVPAMLGSRK